MSLVRENVLEGEARAEPRPTSDAPARREPHPPTSTARASGRLALTHVTRRFDGTKVAAIEDITLTCEPGEFVVVVGPSGCGKTTLLNMAAGITIPDEGFVDLDGFP